MIKLLQFYTPENKEKLHSLFWLRGIASLMVCLFHFKQYIWHEANHNNILKFFSTGHFGVFVFFIISGFVIPFSLFQKKYRLKNFGKFILKRTIRIEPPYIITILMILLWGWYSVTKIWGGNYSVNCVQVFFNLTYLAPFFNIEWINVIFWTLAIEFQYYLFLGLFYNNIEKNKYFKYFLFVIMILLGQVIPEKFQTLLHNYVYFIVGYAVFEFYVKRTRLTEFLILISLCLLFIFYNTGFVSFLYCLFSVLGILFLNYKNKISYFFGNISYSLYLTHGLAGGTLVVFCEKSMPPKVLFVVILFNAICFAHVFYLFIEKKFLSLSQKIK